MVYRLTWCRCVRELLRSGAELHHVHAVGLTVLHQACCVGCVTLVKLLFEEGRGGAERMLGVHDADGFSPELVVAMKRQRSAAHRRLFRWLTEDLFPRKYPEVELDERIWDYIPSALDY